MLLVAILTIAAFTLFYSTTQLDQLGRNTAASIYGKSLSNLELQQEARGFELALVLGLTDFASFLSGGKSDDNGVTEFVWNRLILRHEAAELGIQPTDQQVAMAIARSEPFQTSGQFDRSKYDDFRQNQLVSRGITERQMEDLVRDSLRFDRVRTLIGSAPAVTAEEVQFTGRAFQPVTGRAILFNRQDYVRQVEVTDAEIEAFYEQHRAELQSEDLRAVRYVTFELPAEQQKLEGKEKTDALQKIANQAVAFLDKASATSLDQAAQAGALKVESTPDFDRLGKVVLPTSGDTAISSLSGPPNPIVSAAFLLTSENRLSNVLQDGDKFYVVELLRSTPPRALSLQDARGMIDRQLRDTKAQAMLETAAAKAIEAVRSAMAQGKTFAEAAGEAKLKLETITKVAPLSSDSTVTSQQRVLANSMLLLNEGEVSSVFVQPQGAYAVYLEKRFPVDATAVPDQQAQVREFLSDQNEEILLFDWLRASREKAQVRMYGQDG